MSIWSDIHKRSNGSAVRKEDVDAKIAEALSEIKFKYNFEDTIILEVKSEDNGGLVYANYVLCHVSMLLNVQTLGFCLTLNTNENVKAIKNTIGDRKIKSILLPSTITK